MDKNIKSSNVFLSILMPCYNVEKYIHESILSILDQDFINFELIILDDASTDSTVDIVNTFDDQRIKLFINKTNLGVAKTRNLLLSYSKGNFIAFFDSDDISLKDRFFIQINYLLENPSIDIVFAKIRYIDEFGQNLYFRKIDKYLNANEIGCELLFNNVLFTSTVVFRSYIKSLIVNDSVSFIAEDYFLWALVFVKNKNISCLNKKLVKYRIRESGSTSQYLEKLKSSLDIIHRLLLENLGLKINQQILDVHNSYYLFKYLSETQIAYLLSENDKLFNDIIENNSRENVYKKTLLERSIKKNWYLKCRVASKYIHFKSLGIYKNSNYSNFYYYLMIWTYIIYYNLRLQFYEK